MAWIFAAMILKCNRMRIRTPRDGERGGEGRGEWGKIGRSGVTAERITRESCGIRAMINDLNNLNEAAGL